MPTTSAARSMTVRSVRFWPPARWWWQSFHLDGIGEDAGAGLRAAARGRSPSRQFAAR